jgi:Fic family protein
MEESNAHHIGAADWMNLGEARSKCDHLAGVPIHPAIAVELAKVHLIKGAVETAAIKGNTLTEAEVRSYVDEKATVERSRQYQLVEVQNVLYAIQEIDKTVRDQTPMPLTVQRLLEINETFFTGPSTSQMRSQANFESTLSLSAAASTRAQIGTRYLPCASNSVDG